LKKCTKCEVTQVLANFYKSKTNRDGYINTCKICRSEMSRNGYLRNREKVIRTTRAYSAANKDKISERKKAYHIANREELQKYWREYYSKNKDRMNESSRLYHSLNKEKAQNYSLTKLYGITLVERDLMLKGQGGCCTICSIPEQEASRGRLHVDHNHTTGLVRGLLCHACNTAIGLLRDSPDITMKATEYLIKHQKIT